MKMLILPDMRLASLQAFLDEFAGQLKQATLLITDGATAHRRRHLKIAEELNLELLPPYSPALNPVERFFREIRRKLKNRMFITHEEVEKAVIEIAKPYLKAKAQIKK